MPWLYKSALDLSSTNKLIGENNGVCSLSDATGLAGLFNNILARSDFTTD